MQKSHQIINFEKSKNKPSIKKPEKITLCLVDQLPDTFSIPFLCVFLLIDCILFITSLYDHDFVIFFRREEKCNSVFLLPQLTNICFLLLIVGLHKTCYIIHRQVLCTDTNTEFLIIVSHNSHPKYNTWCVYNYI